MPKKYNLTEEETKIVNLIESGKLKSVKNLNKEKLKLQKIAKNTILKKKAISIRLFEVDIKKIKAKSIKEGIPYQTIISSVIHKYANANLIEKT